MSPDDYVTLPEYQCRGKIGFNTKARAKLIAKRTMTRSGGGVISAYLCVHCGFFHVGHAPRRKAS